MSTPGRNRAGDSLSSASPPGFVGLRLWVEQEVDAHVRAAVRKIELQGLQGLGSPEDHHRPPTESYRSLEAEVASLAEEHRTLAAELRQLRAAAALAPAGPDSPSRASLERGGGATRSPRRSDPRCAAEWRAVSPEQARSLRLSVADQGKELRRLAEELAALRGDVEAVRADARGAAEGGVVVEAQSAAVKAARAYWGQFRDEVLEEAVQRASAAWQGDAARSLGKLRADAAQQLNETAAASAAGAAGDAARKGLERLRADVLREAVEAAVAAAGADAERKAEHLRLEVLREATESANAAWRGDAGRRLERFRAEVLDEAVEAARAALKADLSATLGSHTRQIEALQRQLHAAGPARGAWAPRSGQASPETLPDSPRPWPAADAGRALGSPQLDWDEVLTAASVHGGWSEAAQRAAAAASGGPPDSPGPQARQGARGAPGSPGSPHGRQQEPIAREPAAAGHTSPPSWAAAQEFRQDHVSVDDGRWPTRTVLGAPPAPRPRPAAGGSLSRRLASRLRDSDSDD